MVSKVIEAIKAETSAMRSRLQELMRIRSNDLRVAHGLLGCATDTPPQPADNFIPACRVANSVTNIANPESVYEQVVLTPEAAHRLLKVCSMRASKGSTQPLSHKPGKPVVSGAQISTPTGSSVDHVSKANDTASRVYPTAPVYEQMVIAPEIAQRLLKHCAFSQSKPAAQTQSKDAKKMSANRPKAIGSHTIYADAPVYEEISLSPRQNQYNGKISALPTKKNTSWHIYEDITLFSQPNSEPSRPPRNNCSSNTRGSHKVLASPYADFTATTSESQLESTVEQTAQEAFTIVPDYATMAGQHALEDELFGDATII